MHFHLSTSSSTDSSIWSYQRGCLEAVDCVHDRTVSSASLVGVAEGSRKLSVARAPITVTATTPTIRGRVLQAVAGGLRQGGETGVRGRKELFHLSSPSEQVTTSVQEPALDYTSGGGTRQEGGGDKESVERVKQGWVY